MLHLKSLPPHLASSCEHSSVDRKSLYRRLSESRVMHAAADHRIQGLAPFGNSISFNEPEPEITGCAPEPSGGLWQQALNCRPLPLLCILLLESGTSHSTTCFVLAILNRGTRHTVLHVLHSCSARTLAYFWCDKAAGVRAHCLHTQKPECCIHVPVKHNLHFSHTGNRMLP